MQIKNLVASVAMIGFAGVASADTSPVGAGGAFPDATVSNSLTGQGVFTSIINVPASGALASVNFVSLNSLAHTWIGDLQVSLTAPNGDNMNLFSRIGVTTATGFGNSNNTAGNYVINQSSPMFGPAALVPAGTYGQTLNNNAIVVQQGGVDADTFSVFNGDNVNGNWTLTVRDFGGGDVGSLGNWSFDYTLVPAPGAMALLGLAGLVGGGRRRRA